MPFPCLSPSPSNVGDEDSPLGPSITPFAYPSYLLEISLTASYPAVSRTTASSEKMSDPVPEMCHEGKTMQRSVVSQVNSICFGKSAHNRFGRRVVMGVVHSCCTLARRRPCQACRGPYGRDPCVNDPWYVTNVAVEARCGCW